MSLQFYLLILYILIAFIMDVRFNKIPNWLTVSGGNCRVGLSCYYRINWWFAFLITWLSGKRLSLIIIIPL